MAITKRGSINGFTVYPDETVTSPDLSLAIRLVDDYTGKHPVGPISVTLKGTDLKAAGKPDGWYIFTGLRLNEYRLLIDSEYYFAAEKEIDASTSELEPIHRRIDIHLTPKSHYPFPANATSVHAALLKKSVDAEPRERGEKRKKEPIPGAVVEAAVGPLKIIPKATLKSAIDVGDASISLSHIVGAIEVGDILMVADYTLSRVEFCTIASPLPKPPKDKEYETIDAFRHAHKVGAFIYRAATVEFPENTPDAILVADAKRGDESIRLNNVEFRIEVNDILLINDEDRSRVEFCKIVAPLPDASPPFEYRLENALRFQHHSGSKLFLVMSKLPVVKTDAKGEFVVYFRIVTTPKFQCALKISHPGFKDHEQAVEVVEGESRMLNAIELQPS